MSETNPDDKVFKALSSPVRRRLLDALRDNPQTTGELCARFARLDRCTVMQHLGVLEAAGLVLARRVGRQRWNYLNAIPIKRIHDRWIGTYAANAVNQLDRMKDRMERARPSEGVPPKQKEEET